MIMAAPGSRLPGSPSTMPGKNCCVHVPLRTMIAAGPGVASCVMKVIIVGGGIGGLTTALMLHERGIDCEIYEQSETIRELGVGINTLPHAIKELAELKLLDALDAAGIRTYELVYTNRFGQGIWRGRRVAAGRSRHPLAGARDALPRRGARPLERRHALARRRRMARIPDWPLHGDRRRHGGEVGHLSDRRGGAAGSAPHQLGSGRPN